MMRTILFDFDGTLADSFGVVVEIFYDLTGHERIDDPAQIQRLRRLPIMKVVKELHVSPIQVPRLLVKGRKLMNERMEDVRPFKGIPEAMAELQRQGHTVYIMSSNSKQNVEAFLDANGLTRYVTKVYGNIGLLNKAGAIRKVIRQNGLRLEDCVYIGDEVRDIDGAQRAGIPIVSVGWGYNDATLLESRQPDTLIYQPEKLVESIENL